MWFSRQFPEFLEGCPHLVPYETIAEDPCLILLGEPGIGKSTALATHVLETQQHSSTAMHCLHFDLRAYGSEQRLQRSQSARVEIHQEMADAEQYQRQHGLPRQAGNGFRGRYGGS